MKQTKITITEEQKIGFGRGQVNKMITEAEPGDYMLKLEEWKSARTNLQNNFMHLCFDKYGEEVGLTPDEAKDYLKKRYGINRLYKDPDTGEQLLLVRHTSDYNLEEGAIFIDRMLTHFEHDLGLIIDPKLRKQYKIDELTGELKEAS